MKAQHDVLRAAQYVWQIPIALEQYDQSATLTPIEQETLAAFIERDQHGKPKRWSAETKARLNRLWEPLQDILQTFSGKQAVPDTVSHVLIKEMHQRQMSFWGWSEQQWGETLERSVAAFVHKHGCDPYGRQDLVVIAYVLGKLTFLKGWAPQEMQRERVARKMFGDDRINSAVERVYGIVVESKKEWGYSLANMHRAIGMAVCWAFLVNRNPHLEAISFAFLTSLRELTRDARMIAGLFHLSRALADLHIIERGLAVTSHIQQPVWTRRETDGISAEWVEWCHRWYQAATGLAHTTKCGYLGTLFKVGRWLASRHPEITSPQQWTYQIAAEWVQMVDIMKVGDWANEEQLHGKSIGKPISPRSKVQHLAALKTFFRDLQEEPFHLPRTFNPYHSFRIPQAISRLIGPDPRDIDARWWAMIVQAALDLTEADLPSTNRAYPLELVRALAIAWVYSGLRSNELVRLRTGCIRWQHEEVTVAETGERVDRAAFCFLTVPVNKTYTSFSKPVNVVVGKAINEWERVRPAYQPRLLDGKTNEMVDFLFCYRGHRIAKDYLNNTLIPVLCKRAGLPRADERGNITSHRARATIATLLYNAPEGLSLFELMKWLGHVNPATTQHYTRIKPTKLAAAYSKADRNSRLIEALVETRADVEGKVKIYYILGDHGWCSNADWSSCLYRMACIKCPFFVPKEQAQLIEARTTMKRFLEVVNLTSEEIIAAQSDLDKLDETLERTKGLPRPTVLRQRAKGSTQRGIPLAMLNPSQGEEREAHANDHERNASTTA